MTAGMPPTVCRSSMTYAPLGLKSASSGVWSLTLLKVVDGQWQRSTDLAMAIRWSTALVEPPSTETITMAFSNASRVMMSRGFRSSSSRFLIAAPAREHSSSFAGSSAGVEEL